MAKLEFQPGSLLLLSPCASHHWGPPTHLTSVTNKTLLLKNKPRTTKHTYLVICHQKSENFMHYVFLGPLCISFVMRQPHFWRIIQRCCDCFSAFTFGITKAWSLLIILATNKASSLCYGPSVQVSEDKIKIHSMDTFSFTPRIATRLTQPTTLFCSYYQHKTGPREMFQMSHHTPVFVTRRYFFVK